MARVALLYFDMHTGYVPGIHHGLAYIIGTLKSDGHAVSLHHFSEERQYEGAIRFLGQEKIDVVGLSFTTNQKMYAREFLSRAGSALAGKMLLAGGVHSTLVGEELFEEFPELDGLCVGEGDFPLLELCRRLDRGEDHRDTPSFIFRDGAGIRKNAVMPLQPIDEFPMPDYSLFDYRTIIAANNQGFPMMLSRGCPYDCSYCCNHIIREKYPNKAKYVRFPSVAQAMKIIRSNLALYPEARMITFGDDTFTLNKTWITEFLDAYDREVKLPFSCNARVETINEQIVERLRRSGCRFMGFGVESGSEWLRRHVLNRKHSNQDIERAFATVRRHGIKILAFNMVGLPFETERMARETFELNLRLRPNTGLTFFFFPFPGSRMHKLCTEFALTLPDIERHRGYLNAPSMKELFMTHRQMRRYQGLMMTYIFLRRAEKKLGIELPVLLERLLVRAGYLVDLGYRIVRKERKFNPA